MARIPESELERIKAEVDLAALVRSKGIELKRHGSKDLVGKCPFHADDTASLIITPSKNLWHCMGCGKGGTVIDFVMAHDGLSFRHAFELLAGGEAKTLMRSGGPVKRATAPKLESPVRFDADEEALKQQVLDYYHERLKQTPAALEYLQRRGITMEAIEHFRIGFADRTLGLRLPGAATKAGGEVRERLKKIGLLRAETGHEHFNGCVVFAIKDEAGRIAEVYGRKINDNLRPGTAYHLYLPGPHGGVFNGECLRASRDLILCESVIDALTFWCAGLRNVTCIYGTEGFGAELFQAILAAKTQRVYLAYDRDEAGERAAQRDAQRLMAKGIECFRVQLPGGMDVNEYAAKVRPAGKSLGLLIASAVWLGKGKSQESEEDRAVDTSSAPMKRPSGSGKPESVSVRPTDLGSSLAAEMLAAEEAAPVPMPFPLAAPPLAADAEEAVGPGAQSLSKVLKGRLKEKMVMPRAAVWR